MQTKYLLPSALSVLLLLNANFIQAADSQETIEPEVIIKQKEDSTVEEYRVHGKLYAIKVTPKNCWVKFLCHPYYLVDVNGNGSFVKSDLENADLLIPKWTLFSWK